MKPYFRLIAGTSRFLLEDSRDNLVCSYELHVNNFVKRKMVVFGFRGNQRLYAPVIYGQLQDFDMFVFSYKTFC